MKSKNTKNQLKQIKKATKGLKILAEYFGAIVSLSYAIALLLFLILK